MCLSEVAGVMCAARAAVAQAATDIVDRRRAMLSPIVEALDGPAADTAMAPRMMPMAPMMAPMTAPMAAMAPAVEVRSQLKQNNCLQGIFFAHV